MGNPLKLDIDSDSASKHQVTQSIDIFGQNVEEAVQSLFYLLRVQI